MKYIQFLALTGLVLFSCERIKPDTTGIAAYYNVDSLIRSQVLELSEGNFQIEKTVLMDDTSETKIMTLDSAGWIRELNFLDQLNINQPRLVGAYDSLMDGSVIKYTPKFNSELPIRFLEIEKNNKELLSISGKLVEKNDIYETSMEATLNFKNNLLDSYIINGYQKLILKDSVFYEIKASVHK